MGKNVGPANIEMLQQTILTFQGEGVVEEATDIISLVGKMIDRCAEGNITLHLLTSPASDTGRIAVKEKAPKGLAGREVTVSRMQKVASDAVTLIRQLKATRRLKERRIVSEDVCNRLRAIAWKHGLHRYTTEQLAMLTKPIESRKTQKLYDEYVKMSASTSAEDLFKEEPVMNSKNTEPEN